MVGFGNEGIMNNKIWKLMMSSVAALMLCACAGGPNERSTGEVIDDTTIFSKTKAAMVADPEIKATSVDVDVKNGTVTLTGVARSEAEKKKMVDTAWGVKGVKAVMTKIEVRAPNP